MKQSATSILVISGIVAIIGLVGMDLIRGGDPETPEPVPATVETTPAAVAEAPAGGQDRPSPLGEEVEPEAHGPRPGERPAM